MAKKRKAHRSVALRPGAPFDGPLASFLDAAVRFEDWLSRVITPVARRIEDAPVISPYDPA